MPVQLVKDWLRGKAKHDQCSKSSRCKDFISPNVNIVHVTRQTSLPQSSFRKLLHRAPDGWLGSRATVQTADPEVGVSRLLGEFSHVHDADTRHVLEFLNRDICEITEIFRTDLGFSGNVNVKLQPIRSVTCPKFHADTVKARCLCTYAGQGTWFIENRHVKRQWMLQRAIPPWDPAAVSVQQVDEEFAEQAQPGDLLFLKGHVWPGNYGLGAVHRSPMLTSGVSALEDEDRLMLTVDDVVQEDKCACGSNH